MLDPRDLRTIEFIKKKSNLKILPRLTTPESIKNILSQYRKTLKAEFKELIKKHYGKEYTDEQAREGVYNLLNLFRVLLNCDAKLRKYNPNTKYTKNPINAPFS